MKFYISLPNDFDCAYLNHGKADFRNGSLKNNMLFTQLNQLLASKYFDSKRNFIAEIEFLDPEEIAKAIMSNMNDQKITNFTVRIVRTFSIEDYT